MLHAVYLIIIQQQIFQKFLFMSSGHFLKLPQIFTLTIQVKLTVLILLIQMQLEVWMVQDGMF